MHVIVWEYNVPEAHRAAFERAYGPKGDWVVLFQSAPGYLGTELFRDEQIPGRYLTIDRWNAQDDFAAFKQLSSATYESLDRQFEGLSSHEVKVGTFQSIR
jgi:heme-degrading monooxygenase HmoA